MFHRPERFASPMAQAVEFVRRQRFGLLVSQLDGELQFSYLPVLVDVDGERITRLRGHFARANPHWRALQRDARATFVCYGPHHYVSAQWYSPECQAASSWNFVTVHLNGTVRLLDTPEQTTEIINELVAVNEAALPTQWDISRYSPTRRAALTPHILGFALDVDAVEPKFKLNQHYADADKIGAIAGLRSLGDGSARQIADLMELTLGQGSRDQDITRRMAAASGDAPGSR